MLPAPLLCGWQLQPARYRRTLPTAPRLVGPFSQPAPDQLPLLQLTGRATGLFAPGADRLVGAAESPVPTVLPGLDQYLILVAAVT